MIRFACPRCRAVLDRPDAEAGTKLACPGCQQRLQVPQPPANKTVLGELEPLGSARPQVEPRVEPPSPAIEIRPIQGRDHAVWTCPACRNPVSAPIDLGQSSVRCPHCTRKIDLPKSEAGGARVQQMVKAGPGALPPPNLDVVEEYETTRRARDDSWDDEEDDEPRRRRARYEDVGRPRYRSERNEDECARAAMTGFLCSMASLGLVMVGFIFWMALIAHTPRGRGADPLVFLMLGIGLGSFVLGLIGVVFSSRGLDEANQRNRGMATAGLVCGIVGMVIGLLGSAFFFCIGMVIFSLNPWR